MLLLGACLLSCSESSDPAGRSAPRRPTLADLPRGESEAAKPPTGSAASQDSTAPAGESPEFEQAPAAEDMPEAVTLDGATQPLEMEILTEFGYEGADGVLILDVLERDYLYLTLLIQDADGRPVRGVLPEVTPGRDSRFIPVSGEEAVSDEYGSYSFALMGGSMGEERVRIAVGDLDESVLLNVISLEAAGYAALDEIEGVLPWSLLFQADIEWGERITATFPDAIQAKSGQSVRLAGFMLPLEMTEKQKHFVLASNPPGCFFHVPGGPAGAVEVFAEEALEIGYEPIVLEGQFEALATSESGVLYRLRGARPVKP